MCGKGSAYGSLSLNCSVVLFLAGGTNTVSQQFAPSLLKSCALTEVLCVTGNGKLRLLPLPLMMIFALPVPDLSTTLKIPSLVVALFLYL